MTEPQTLPALLKRNAERFGDRRVAIREKEFGIWQSVTWKGYYDQCARFRPGASSDWGSSVVKSWPTWVTTDPRASTPNWRFSAWGAPSWAFTRTATRSRWPISSTHSDARFVVAGDQEQADKILEIQSECPLMEKVIVDDPKGMRHYDDPILHYFKDIQALGRELAQERPGFFDELIAAVVPEDIGMINYTSGTTGIPKGSMLTHKNMVSVAKFQDQVDTADESFEYVSFLPLPWIGEQEFGVYWPLYKGFAVNFPEKVETVQENIREIGPHIMLAPPRIWEKMCSEIQVKIQEAVWIKRLAYRTFLPVGYRMAAFVLEKRRPPLGWRLLNWIAYFMVFRSLKNYFGLSRLRHVYTGGAPLGPEIFHLFLALGVRIKQAYGATEQTAASIIHRTDDIRLDTVGQPLPGIEVRVSDTGELLSKGDTIFCGYYKMPEATEKTLRDGWFYSGDAAVIDDDGHVIIIDRMADVMKLADGSSFSPQLIENKLKFSPYIMDAVVVGQNRPYITAMVVIDQSNVGKWAENRQIPYTTLPTCPRKKRSAT